MEFADTAVCGPRSTVPVPMSLSLLLAGLAGLAVASAAPRLSTNTRPDSDHAAGRRQATPMAERQRATGKATVEDPAKCPAECGSDH